MRFISIINCYYFAILKMKLNWEPKVAFLEIVL